MGSFSLWHWLILLVLLLVPLAFILQKPPTGANRFGGPPLAMGFTEAISSFFKNYATFSGRASRSEFWFSMLFNIVIMFVIDFIDPTEVISGIWSLATLLPMLAVSARRLHDINRSGWHQLLSSFFPIGTIAMIVWYCKPADDGVIARTPPIAPPVAPQT